MRHILCSIDKKLGRIELFLVQVSVLAIVLIMTAQIIFRYVFNAPIYWAEEVCVLMMINMTFFGLSCLVHFRTLVSVHMLRTMVSERTQQILSIIVALTIMVILGVLTYHAMYWVANPNTWFEMSETIGIPKWTLYSIMPTAMIATTYHYSIYVSDLILGEHGGKT